MDHPLCNAIGFTQRALWLAGFTQRGASGLVHYFAERLRSKLATATAAAGSDNEPEWYMILTLWSPLQVNRLLEDSSEQAVRLRQNSPFVSLLSTPEQRGTTPDPE